MKKILSLLLSLTIYSNCYAQQSSAFLDKKMLGEAPHQGQLQTCVRWSLLYGMLSYHHNIKLKNLKPTFFNPCYNLKKQCNDLLYICDLLKSINNDGLLDTSSLATCNCTDKILSKKIDKYYNSNLITVKSFDVKKIDFILTELKEEISKKNHGFVLCYSSKYDPNADDTIKDYHVQTFTKSSFGDKDLYKHAIFCIGYDNNKQMPNNAKGGFLFRDSDLRDKHEGEVWISYDELKKGFVEEVFLYNDQMDGVVFDKTKHKVCLPNKNYGTSKNRPWWLGCPAPTWKLKKKYYFTEHFGFRVTVLKLRLALGAKATIGILNQKNKRLYSFDLRPMENVVFSVNNKTYQFFYKNKSFKKGFKLYPEINYYIKRYDCSTSIPYN